MSVGAARLKLEQERVAALVRIADASERIAHALQPQPAQPMPGSCPTCGAPEEKQVNAGTLNEPNKKQCMVCGKDYE